MAQVSIPKPTDAELAILRVLWAKSPCTVRDVYEVVSKNRSLAYTSTLKILQVMTEKGLVTREDFGQQHRYRARQTERVTQRRLIRDLLQRAFGGSTSQLVMQALATKKASREERQAIRRLLADYEENDHE